MKPLLTISQDEAIRVLRILEKMNQIFHQPLIYEDRVQMEKLARDFYPEIKDLYYNIVWNWLPEHVQKELEE